MKPRFLELDRCPLCGERALTNDSVEHYGEGWEDLTCTPCGIAWRQVYRIDRNLTEITYVNEDGTEEYFKPPLRKEEESAQE